MAALVALVAAVLLAACAIDDSGVATVESAAGKTCIVVGSVTKSERGTFYCTPVNGDEKVWKPHSAYKSYEIRERIDNAEPALSEAAASHPMENERFLAAEQVMTDLAEQEPSLEGKLPSEYYGERMRWCIDVMGAAIDYRSAKSPETLMPEIYFRCGGGTSDYENCSEARAAGVDPLYRGEKGYDGHLDRDSDGIACEK
ncbi:excalibur calcium-binding domain-containing protein [Citricoccus nitrophenolicus]